MKWLMVLPVVVLLIVAAEVLRRDIQSGVATQNLGGIMIVFLVGGASIITTLLLSRKGSSRGKGDGGE